MKKRNNFEYNLLAFVLCFLGLGETSICSIVVYNLVTEATGGNVVATTFAVFAVVVIGALLCLLFEILRKKFFVEKPTKKILDATKRIASGDFNVKLVHENDYAKYDDYDLIFDNINTMTAELSKNEVLKTDFISNVSHEIKTPITVIQNYTKVLKSKTLSEEKRAEYFEGLVLQTQKLSDMVTNILQLTKLETQQTMPKLEELDLAELVRLSVLQFEKPIEKKNISLECDIEDIKIKNSANLLELVFNNLISNAIKFTDKGGKISVSLKEEENCAVVKVSDTGCGISSEIGKHIFDKFYQGDSSHSTEGNGLGLALVKKVIDIVGGEISVESKVGEGSAFTIKLKKE